LSLISSLRVGLISSAITFTSSPYSMCKLTSGCQDDTCQSTSGLGVLDI
jgi:hypothetical protein